MQLSRLERSLLFASRHFLSPDDGSGGGNNDSSSDASANAGGQSGDKSEGEKGEKKVEFTAEQQEHIGKLLSKERKAAADKAKADAKSETDAAAEQSRKDKEAEDARKAGDFEKVETTLKNDLETAKGEVKTLTEQNQALRDAMKTGVEAQWKELPASLQVAGKFIGEDDILARWNYLHDADVQKQIAEANKADPKRGNGRDPKSTGDGNVEIKSLIPKQAFLG